MSCMEHSCSCGFVTFNNWPRTPAYCPRCDGELRHDFDEPEEDEPADYPDEEP